MPLSSCQDWSNGKEWPVQREKEGRKGGERERDVSELKLPTDTEKARGPGEHTGGAGSTMKPLPGVKCCCRASSRCPLLEVARCC